MTVENILKIIEANRSPFWVLKLGFGTHSSNGGRYDCENMPEGASIDQKIEGSKEALRAYLKIFETIKGQVFYIEMKTSKTGNQGSIYGPFPFTIDEPKPETQHPNANGLSGFGIGNLSANDYFEAERQKMRNEFDKILLDRDKQNFEAERKMALGEISLKRKAAEKKSLPLEMALGKIITMALPLLTGGGLASVASDGLAGTPETSEPDEREELATEIAELLYDSGASAHDLKNILNQFKQNTNGATAEFEENNKAA